MAQKRVNVRLVASGGKQVKAELEGIGQAGERGFRKVSREAQIADARLARFGRRVKIAFATMAAAAAAGTAVMVRSGLQVINEQAKLAQSLGTTTESIQVLARAGEIAGVSMSGIEQATKDLTRRLSQAAAGGGPAAAALDRLGLSAEQLLQLPLDERVGAINAAIEEFVPVAERAAVAGQLFGEEGSIAMSRIDTSTLRQATEDVRDFGVVVSAADAAQIQRTNDALSRLGLIWRGLSNQLAVAAAPALEAIADALAAIAKTTGPLGRAIKGLFNHLGEIVAIAGTFAAFMVGRWVAGMVAAALAVGKLSLSLKVLKGALIRTGFGALIVAAGELVYWFGRLVKGAGGFGAAMGLLKDVALEVWNRIADGAYVIVLRVRAISHSIMAAWTDALAYMQDKWARFLKVVSGALFKIPGMKDVAMAIGLDAAFAGQAVEGLRDLADEYRFYAGNLSDQSDILAGNILRPLKSVQALKEAVVSAGEEGSDALTDAASAANDVTRAVTGAGNAADDAGNEAQSSWFAAAKTLKDYATKSMDVVAALGNTIVGAFNRGADAIADFVRTGKLDFASLITSMLADLARLASQKFIFGPLANMLSGAFGSLGGLFGSIFHDGGVAGSAAPQRLVPATAFAGAPRMHSGGWAGLRPDEVPAILQRGERVLSRREVAAGVAGVAPVNITIVTRDAESFRQSRTQVAADLSRAVALGRRGM